MALYAIILPEKI